jgi:tetratricopeptide (TPR) repeat protein
VLARLINNLLGAKPARGRPAALEKAAPATAQVATPAAPAPASAAASESGEQGAAGFALAQDDQAPRIAVLLWLRWDPLPPFAADQLYAHPLRARAAEMLAMPAGEDGAETLLRTLIRDHGAQPIDRLLLVEVLLRRGLTADVPELLRDAEQFPPALRGRAGAIRGQLCYDQGDFPAARRWADLALAATPEAWAANVLHGLLLAAERLWDAAIDQYRRLVARRPDHTGVRITLGTLLSEHGRNIEGLQEVMTAELLANAAPAAQQVPVWDGRLAEGDALLVVAASAIGDTIQLMRYFPALRARAPRARLVLRCSPAIAPLARSMAVFDEVSTSASPSDPRFCGQATLIHLALLHLTHHAPLRVPDPYLGCDPARVAAMRQALEARLPAAAAPALRVGLRWCSQAGGGDVLRSVPPACLGPLFGVPGIVWVALLERGHGDRGLLGAGGIPAIDMSDHLADLVDTAALMQNLDLVVTVDTSIAHLSGALGRPTWLMSRPDMDRWGDGERTGLYASMRVFRHLALRLDWEQVAGSVAAALRERVGSHRAGREAPL